jgi:hypothetical protein
MYIDALEIADAWNKGLDGNGVTVAVMTRELMELMKILKCFYKRLQFSKS